MEVIRIGGEILLLIVFTLLLVKATDLVVASLHQLADRTHLAKFGLAAFLLALSTSFPELFIGIVSALEGTPNLSLGNVVGSNIANLSLVIGGAALISGSVPVVGEYLRKDFMVAFLAGSLPLLLLMDGSLSRVDGLVLVVLYGFYLFSVFHHKHAKAVEAERTGLGTKILRGVKLLGGPSVRHLLIKLLLGAGLILVSAEMLVKAAQGLAVDLKIPVLLVGLFLVTAGTTLPELTVGVRAIAKKEAAVVFGNLLGSIAANSTLIIGLVALMAPIKVEAIRSYLLASITYVLMFWLFWLLTRTKRRLDRWEGAVLVAVYLVFVGTEFLLANGLGQWLRGLIGFGLLGK